MTNFSSLQSRHVDLSPRCLRDAKCKNNSKFTSGNNVTYLEAHVYFIFTNIGTVFFIQGVSFKQKMSFYGLLRGIYILPEEVLKGFFSRGSRQGRDVFLLGKSGLRLGVGEDVVKIGRECDLSHGSTWCRGFCVVESQCLFKARLLSHAPPPPLPPPPPE
jgi:hypothetical protein